MRCNSDVSGKKLIQPKLKQTRKRVGKDSKKRIRTKLEKQFKLKLIKPKLKQTGKSVGKDSRKELRTQLKNSFAWVYIVNFTNVGQQYLSSFTLYFGE